MRKDREEGLRPNNQDLAEHLFEDLGGDMVLGPGNRGMVFFKPDMKFVKWLIGYAQGRMIVEIGCGSAHLLHMIRSQGYNKVMGIEPAWNPMAPDRHMDYKNPLHVLPWTVDKAANMLHELTKLNSEPAVEERAFQRTILVIARPNHEGFTEEAIDAVDPNTEVLYITRPENLEEYEDLGKYSSIAKQLEHDGSGQDQEVVLSVIKP